MNIVKNNQISRSATKFGFDDKTSSQLDFKKKWTTKNLVL
jgi:hypothetical protein